MLQIDRIILGLGAKFRGVTDFTSILGSERSVDSQMQEFGVLPAVVKAGRRHE